MVNRDTNKWSDPYVGALIYQELIYLKNNLQTGTIILNCAQPTIENVFEEITDDFVNRGQMLGEHKELVNKILLSQYRSQRAIAGAIVGRKTLKTDVLPSIQGNSRLISVNSLSKHMNTEGLGKNSFVFSDYGSRNTNVIHKELELNNDDEEEENSTQEKVLIILKF